MKLSFHGAARCVTGTKHLITLNNGKRILLDCGLFQGMGPQTEELNSAFHFDASSVDALILSHAHIDHSGLIPKLVKEGFTGKIYCTKATRDLAEVLLYDSAEIQTYELGYNKPKGASDGLTAEPLYNTANVEEAMTLFTTCEFEEWFEVIEGVQMMFTHNGHLIGSAAVHLKIAEERTSLHLTFSGDVGRFRSPLLAGPKEFPQADYIILESTYGDKQHDMVFNTIETLSKWIKDTCINRGGKLIIPAFSVGRTQEVLYALNQLSLENRLPELNYFVDSPMSIKATEVIKSYTEEFNDRLQKVLEIDDDPFAFKGLKYIETVEDSRQLARYTEPCVIISASGTADAGRVRHHIAACVHDPKNTILMVGYCEAYSLGGQLLSGAKQVELFGESIPVQAEIGQMKSMSAHGDNDDLVQFLNCQDPQQVKKIFLVHGEYPAQQQLAARLERKGFPQVEIPNMHYEFELQ